MMNRLIICIILILLSISCYAQEEVNILGVYANRFDSLRESLELSSDSTFSYCLGCSVNGSLGVARTFGYWEVKDSLLILNSIEQIMRVEEYYLKEVKSPTITVLPRNFPHERQVSYNVYCVTARGDTLFFYNQIDQTIIGKKIKSFWIEDIDTGIKSQPYEIVSTKNNVYSVSFYKGVLFENEEWIIIDDKIDPKRKNGLRGYNGYNGYYCKQDSLEDENDKIPIEEYYLIKEKTKNRE